MQRKDAVDRVKACQRLEVSGRRGRGMSKKTWRECVAEDMRVLGLNCNCNCNCKQYHM